LKELERDGREFHSLISGGLPLVKKLKISIKKTTILRAISNIQVQMPDPKPHPSLIREGPGMGKITKHLTSRTRPEASPLPF